MGRKWVTADGLVFEGQGNIDAVTIVSDTVGVVDVTLKDGTNEDGETFLTVRALQNDSRHLAFPGPCPVDQGLYVDIGSNVAGVLIVWHR